MVGHGGVRLGAKKVKEAAANDSKGSGSIHSGLSRDREVLKTELREEFSTLLKANNEVIFSNFRAILQRLGHSEEVTVGVFDDLQEKFVPQDKSSRPPTPSANVPTQSPLDLEVSHDNWTWFYCLLCCYCC